MNIFREKKSSLLLKFVKYSFVFVIASSLFAQVALAIPPSPQAPFTITYTSNSTSITYRVINNGTVAYYGATGDIYNSGSDKRLQTVVFGDLNPSQVVSKTFTSLQPGSSYDLRVQASKRSSGINSQVVETIDYNGAKTTNASTSGSSGTTNPTSGTPNPTSGTPDPTSGTPDPSAGTPGINVTTGITNPLSSDLTSIPAFIEAIINFVLIIGVPIVALAIIYSGFLFVTAQGNSEKLKKAKQTLLYTLIGAALLLGSFIIANAIKGTVDQIKS